MHNPLSEQSSIRQLAWLGIPVARDDRRLALRSSASVPPRAGELGEEEADAAGDRGDTQRENDRERRISAGDQREDHERDRDQRDRRAEDGESSHVEQ